MWYKEKVTPSGPLPPHSLTPQEDFSNPSLLDSPGLHPHGCSPAHVWRWHPLSSTELALLWTSAGGSTKEHLFACLAPRQRLAEATQCIFISNTGQWIVKVPTVVDKLVEHILEKKFPLNWDWIMWFNCIKSRRLVKGFGCAQAAQHLLKMSI